MDILFVRNLFRPQDFGGNRYPWEVTRRLAQRGHRVRVVTPRPDGPLPGPTPVELIYYPASRRTPFETFFTNALFSRVAVRLAELRRRPDVVVLSSYDVAFGHFWMARRGPPAIYIYHSSFYSDAVDRVARKPWPLRLAYSPLRAFTRYVESVAFQGADRIIAVSPFSEREIVARVGVNGRVRVIPTGVDTLFFTPGDRSAARRALGLPFDRRILLVVGRLARVKRYDRAIDTLRIMREGDPSWLLIIAGTGPAEAELRRHAEPLGEAVRFFGFADSMVLRDLYRATDVVLCTSEFENWSLSILEALATGTPVVGTPRGSIPDLLGIVDPSLVADDVDPISIARTATKVAADMADREGFGERAHAVVAARYDWERIVDDLERCFGSVVAGR